jgi:TRAP-type uncharacterized transport system fused permease subunit
MDNVSPRWRSWLKNVGWYLATLMVLIALLLTTRNFVILAALWGVGLIWGGVLAYQLGQRLFEPETLVVSESQLQGYLDQTRAYQLQIDTLLKSASAGERVRLETVVTRLARWTAAIETLVRRLDLLRQDELIRRDLKSVPKAIADLEKRLAKEGDATIRSQLMRTLENRRKQLAALEQLQSVMKRAEIQIESTLSMLGTMYSQILTGQSTSDVADYHRISADVDEEVNQLEDYLTALQEVKLGQSGKMY